MPGKFNYVLIVFMVLASAGCDDKVTVIDDCGDGIIDPGESCDGAAPIQVTCVDLDFHQNPVPVTCAADCTYDVSACGAFCGDGTLQPEFEECEFGNLNGQTCISQGTSGGVLQCGDDCSFDMSRCESQCGNGMVELAEECDDQNLDEGDGCGPLCTVEVGWACADSNPSICGPVCGDGLLRDDEPCDDGNLDDGDGCSQDCLPETGWECDGEPTVCSSICDDGLQVGPEECDQSDLGGADCVSVGFAGGTLACTSSCIFETTACFECGDGVCSADLGETRPICPADCGVVQVDLGQNHSCALRGDGLAWCWG
ncbi:MAG: hypothetical protein CVU65_05630, partial [Deltaproteobacteria bacterium HGW-Deltaproteobacteria-22]